MSGSDSDDVDNRPYSELVKQVNMVNQRSGKELLTIRKARKKGYKIELTNEWKKDFNDSKFLENLRMDL